MGTAQGRRAHVHVTVPYSTLIGIDEYPAELTGYGPIPASIARRIAAGGIWRRLLTDPATGALLDYGRTTYQPPADLRDHVITRDGTCIFPVCAQPAHRCQLDHTTGYPDGPAAAANLGPPCAPHHDLKTRLLWRLDQPEPGRFVWTTPAGKSYIREPAAVGPITTDNNPRQLREPPNEDPDPIDPIEPPTVGNTCDTDGADTTRPIVEPIDAADTTRPTIPGDTSLSETAPRGDTDAP